MWTTVVTGLFTLFGVAVGTAMEPVKSLITARAKTRQVRGEQCAKLIGAVTTIRESIVSLNGDYRASMARQPQAGEEQRHGWIRAINNARDALRQTSNLLYLYGPDDLAAESRKIALAEDAAYRRITTTEEVTDIMSVPAELEAALRELDEATRQFAVLARRYTR
ncbi:hypothetical protein ILP97_42615 [Amycolatopsis sp. H6(2020)]|nr:hypothetical protein [Amycolatopsis sp. H6(2020)]